MLGSGLGNGCRSPPPAGLSCPENPTCANEVRDYGRHGCVESDHVEHAAFGAEDQEAIEARPGCPLEFVLFGESDEPRIIPEASIVRKRGPGRSRLAKLPAGNYTITGPSMQNGESGGQTSGTAWLTHTIPAGPELLTPAKGASVPADQLTVSWKPVTETIDGKSLNLIAYQVIVQKDELVHPKRIGKLGVSMYLPPTVTSVKIPKEILDP